MVIRNELISKLNVRKVTFLVKSETKSSARLHAFEKI